MESCRQDGEGTEVTGTCGNQTRIPLLMAGLLWLQRPGAGTNDVLLGVLKTSQDIYIYTHFTVGGSSPFELP